MGQNNQTFDSGLNDLGFNSLRSSLLPSANHVLVSTGIDGKLEFKPYISGTIVVGTGGLYAQTSDSTPISNTNIETSLINSATGVGTLSVPPNTFNVGDSFHAKLIGVMSSANNQTLDIRIKSDSVVLANTGLISIATSTNRKFEINVYLTIRSLGSAGVASIVSGGVFVYIKNASSNFEGSDFSIVNNTTFNTTISNTLDITAQWGAANPNNSIYSQLFILQKIY